MIKTKIIEMFKNKQKILNWITALILFTSYRTIAQQITLNLDSCMTRAKQNFPLIKQYGLIYKSKEYSIDNANKGYLPQFIILGQATYQSAVTQVPISVSGIDVPTLPKDQYKFYGEVSQPITDLFLVKDRKKLVEANSSMDMQNIEIELYKLKDRINQIYFGILLIDEQMKQNTLLKKDIQSGIDKVNVAIKSGASTKNDLNILEAELLKNDQYTIELKANRKNYVEMLSYFIGKPIDENTILETPLPQIISNAVNRPELKLYDLQKSRMDIQNKLLISSRLPKFSLFLQGGVGRPALNILSNNLEGYYIGGLRLSFDITSFYTYKNEKENIALSQNMIDTQRETFLFNTNLNLRQQNSEIAKIQELIVTDNNIILLRENVKNNMKIQLENGIVTANDYIISTNAEDKARQNLILHQIQLLMAQYNYQIISGN